MNEAFIIIGANGFLGSNILAVLLEQGHPNIIATSLGTQDRIAEDKVCWMECDITQDNQVAKLLHKMSQYDACRVAYLVACHNPDVVQREPRMAWNINIVALAKFLNAADNVACLFYPSTDTVYGEGSLDYAFKETDLLKPVNLYGAHKALAEKLVNTYGYNVVRFPFLIGASLLPMRKHFYDQILDTLRAGNQMEMFEDSYRSAIDFHQAAELLVQCMVRHTPQMPPVLNIAGDDILSKYDLGQMIAQKYGFDPSLVVPISIHADEHIFEAPRAASAVIDNRLIKRFLQINDIHLEL